MAAGKTTMPRMDWRAVRALNLKFLYTASRCVHIRLRNVESDEEGVGAHHGVPSLDGGVRLRRGSTLR